MSEDKESQATNSETATRGTKESMASETDTRRPLASRQQQWARRLSNHLSGTGITPNQISFGSVIFALLALVLLSVSLYVTDGLQAALFIAAAISCQLRLLCNLMDGMVAMEGGKQTPDGALWNELPDRIADIAILLGVGVAAGQIQLALVVIVLAIFVAYVRELGKGIDGVADYSGPMAKPHRMALVTIALVLSALVVLIVSSEQTWLEASTVLTICLWLCGVGAVVTIWRRTLRLSRRLKFKQ